MITPPRPIIFASSMNKSNVQFVPPPILPSRKSSSVTQYAALALKGSAAAVTNPALPVLTSTQIRVPYVNASFSYGGRRGYGLGGQSLTHTTSKVTTAPRGAQNCEWAATGNVLWRTPACQVGWIVDFWSRIEAWPPDDVLAPGSSTGRPVAMHPSIASQDAYNRRALGREDSARRRVRPEPQT